MACDRTVQETRLREMATRTGLEWCEQAAQDTVTRYVQDLTLGRIGGCSASLWAYYQGSFLNLHKRLPTTRFSRKG